MKWNDSENLPPVGFQLKYRYEFAIGSDFQYLANGDGYGWEDEDELEVIYLTEDEEEVPVAIVLNKTPDVLSCAGIKNPKFFLSKLKLLDGEAYQFNYKGRTLKGFYCEDNGLVYKNGDCLPDVCTEVILLSSSNSKTEPINNK